MKRHAGFTLVELLITVAVLAVLLGAVIPLTNHFIDRNRADVVASDLAQTLHFARHAALQHKTRVTWCASSDLEHCDGDWTGKQMIFLDSEGKHQRASDDKLLRVIDPLQKGNALSWKGFKSSKFLELTPFDVGSSMAGQFSYCPANHKGRYERRLVISRVGRARLEKPNQATC